MIRTLSTHNSIPTYLIEADENANDAILQGEALLKQGHVNDAIAVYQSAMQYIPNDPLALQRIAEAYASNGRVAEADKTYHKLFHEAKWQTVGGSSTVFLEYALVLVKTHQAPEAVQMYNHGASMLDYEDSQNNGGKPFLKVLFPEIVMGDPLPDQVQYTPERLQALADVMLAHTQPGFWNYKKIKAYAKEAVKMYPDSAPVQYYLGEVLSISYDGVLESLVKDKAAAQATYQEDKKEEAVAYQKAADLGDEATAAAAKEQLKTMR